MQTCFLCRRAHSKTVFEKKMCSASNALHSCRRYDSILMPLHCRQRCLTTSITFTAVRLDLLAHSCGRVRRCYQVAQTHNKGKLFFRPYARKYGHGGVPAMNRESCGRARETKRTSTVYLINMSLMVVVVAASQPAKPGPPPPAQ